MKVLVIGAGVIGSVYAGRLAATAHEVALLARGSRLDNLRRNGLRLKQWGGAEVRPELNIVDELPATPLDLVILAVRREQAGSAATLAARAPATSVMLFGNYAGMTADLAERVGVERTVGGFPGVGGRIEVDTVAYCLIRQQPTVVAQIGTVRGSRVPAVAGAMRNAGFPTTTQRDVEGWLSSHAALVVPMAAAIRAAGGHAPVLADRSSLLRPAIEATRAIYQAQRRKGRLVINFNLRLLYLVMPEWFAVQYWSRALRGEFGELAFAAHTRHAWSEMALLGAWLRSSVEADPEAVSALDRVIRLAAV